MLRKLLTILAVLLSAIACVAGPAAAAAHGPIYGYDSPTIARVDVHQNVGAEVGQSQFGDGRNGSASTPAEGQTASATPSDPVVATEAAPPRFVAASDGIIDTEAPALQQQIGDVADSIQTTGSPPPGVRQGGLPGKPGVYGNKSGALPTQPEGYYTESDVWPGPGSRGTERIVVGANGEVWYSPDHYGNFRVVRT